MFRRAWSWIAPLVGAAAAFGFVLATTPPGFAGVADLLFGTPRGVNADAAAYALGAAASLALVTLVALAVVFGALDAALRRRG